MQSRLSTLLWAGLFFAVVAGVEGGVLNSLLTQWTQGHTGKVIGLGIFALLLSFLCLAMLFSLGHAGLSLLLPGVRVTSLNFTGRPGETLSFAWEFRRAPQGVRRFQVVLEGFEQRRKSASRNEHWKPQTVLKRTLFESASALDFQKGQLMVALPEKAKPTSMQKLYRMRWVIHLQGEVRFLPDLKETYEVKVLPPESSGAR